MTLDLNTRPLRIGIVGCGNHSKSQHAAPLAHVARLHPGEIALVGACDMERARAEDFRAKYGFEKAYDDLQDMLDDAAPDGVVSVMPIPAITPVGTRLLEQKVPCSIEKPLGRSLDEVRRLAEVAARTGTAHMVSVNRRYTPALVQARELAERLGPVRFIEGKMLRHNRREPDFMWGTGIHIIDAVRFLAGPWGRTHARKHTRGASVAWYDIQLEFEGGASGYVKVLPTAGVVLEEYDLFGDDYRITVRVDPRDSELTVWHKNTAIRRETPPPGTEPYVMNGSLDEVQAFVRMIRDGEPPRATVADVIPALELCLAMDA